MNQYHKIQSVFKRDPENNHKTFLVNQFSIPEFAYLQDNIWQFTEKVDGTNIRLMWDGSVYQIGGKTDNAQIPAPLIQWINENIMIHHFKEAFGSDGGVCLYGEGYGGKIQKAGATYGQQQKFVLFDVKVGEWWLQRDDVESVAQSLDIDHVPAFGRGTLLDMVALCEEGFESVWGSFAAEGIVARPEVELKSRSGHRIITKLKHKDFVR